jgi:hypothetical protein
MKDCNKEMYKLIINVISACTGEKIGSIIVDKNNRTINEWFNNFIRGKYNYELYESDIKIIYNLLQIYSYYDQEIGDKSIEKIDLFKNNKNIQEISVSIVFSDPFTYISDIIRNPDERSNNIKIESYQNLNDYKKQKINELLNMLHYQYQYLLRDINFVKMIYDHIIITKFIAIILLKKDHCFYHLKKNQLNENFCDDREIVKIAVSRNGNALEYASIDLCADREIVGIAVSQHGEALAYASIDLCADREIVGIAVSRNCNALEYAMDFCDDREIIKIVVSQNGMKLKYASKYLRADSEIVQIAVSQNGRALEYASIDLRADKEIVKIALSQNINALEYASYLHADREIIKFCVTYDGYKLRFASKELRADKEIVILAVSKNGMALQYASIDLRADKEIVILAVSNNGMALQYASIDLCADKEIVEIAALHKWRIP